MQLTTNRMCTVCGKGFEQELTFPLHYTCDDCKQLSPKERAKIFWNRREGLKQ